jgi:hypothetical protein
MMRATERDWISIHSVASDLQVELTNEEAWQIGRAVATSWADIMKHQPVKDLRRKKAGLGSHCFALYPPSWFPVFAAAIRMVTSRAARQGRLDL